jgi:hypothetical protein
MRVRYWIAFAAVLFTSGAARAQHLVKPDPAAVARAKKALARAADLDAASAGREAALAEVREAPKIVRFEALAQSVEGSSKKLRSLAAAEIAAMGEHGGLAVLVQGVVREGDRATRADLTRSLAALEGRLRPAAATGTATAAEAGAGAERSGSDAGALFARFLAEQDPRRRIHAMQGISVFPDARAVAPLVAQIESIASGFGRAAVEFTVDRAYIGDWQLVSGGTGLTVVEVADPEVDLVKTGVAMDVQVRRVEMRFAVALLQDLTGASIGADPGAWRAWLREHPEPRLAARR